MHPSLNYLELAVGDLAAARKFYAAAFGWAWTDYGPTYCAASTGAAEIGLQGDRAEAASAPLPIIEVKALEAVHRAVIAASGTITRDIFAFPGGRRFHFTDPDGHQLGVWEKA